LIRKNNSGISRTLKSFVPGVLFLVLALVWSDASPLLRYGFAAAGIAFVVEGIIRFIKRSREDDASAEAQDTDQ
jgi:hypothetical protein